MTELLEVLPAMGATAAGITAFFGGSTYLLVQIDNKATRYSPSEWAALWKEKRDWLVLASQGEQKEGTSDSLREISSILRIAGRPLPGHKTFYSRAKGERGKTPYKNMYLTMGLYYDNDDGKWYLTCSNKHSKTAPNKSQLVIVQGLENLAKLVDEVPKEMTEWHKEVVQLVCEQASHYLLSYSVSPTNMEERIGGKTTIQRMQVHLNNSVERLLEEAKRLTMVENGVHQEESPEEKVIRVRELAQSMAVAASPNRLSLGTLSNEEFELIQSLRSGRGQVEEGGTADVGAGIDWDNWDNSDDEVDEVVTRLLADRADLTEATTATEKERA